MILQLCQNAECAGAPPGRPLNFAAFQLIWKHTGPLGEDVRWLDNRAWAPVVQPYGRGTCRWTRTQGRSQRWKRRKRSQPSCIPTPASVPHPTPGILADNGIGLATLYPPPPHPPDSQSALASQKKVACVISPPSAGPQLNSPPVSRLSPTVLPTRQQHSSR